MKIEKLTNNTYRARKQYKGKRYTVYFDHKPTVKEVTRAIAKEFDRIQAPKQAGTLESYIDKYIEEKEKQTKPPISPATIRGYVSIKRNLPEYFLKSNFYDLTSEDVQKVITEYRRTRSAKTTKNAYSLIRSVFTSYRRDIYLSVKISSEEPKAEYEPTTNDIQRILEYAKGSEYSIALQLSVLGLRREEITALTMEDLGSDNVLSINKGLVVDKNNKLVLKDTKTQTSYRRITLPGPLAEEIREKGYIYKYYPNSILRYLSRVQVKLGIPHFRLHIMRHFCAAYLHKLGFTEEQIMAWNGWKDSSTMKKVYRYNLDPAEAQEKMANAMADLF